MERQWFLPVSRQDMTDRDWYYYDFLVVSGDAYVDHPSFGPAVIARVLEHAGFRVAMLAQPAFGDAEAFRAMGRPRYGVMIGSGNLDSMVAHYTASRRKRSDDFYSPGRKTGLRPDRATIVYAKLAREAFGAETPIIVGGLEASLRRFAHYDYWDDHVRPSVLVDAGADLLVYGMGERTVRLIAEQLRKGVPVTEITEIPGTAFVTTDTASYLAKGILCPSYEEVSSFRRVYAEATKLQYEEHDPVRGRTLLQKHGDRFLVVRPPALPLTRDELDAAAELPYTREAHPDYDELGGVPAFDEVRFSIIHNRGCFGDCNFCSLAWHQGRMVTSRSAASVVREARQLTEHKDFKGYINDVGGPTANFRRPSCKGQATRGMCRSKRCLTPVPCEKLEVDHSEYLTLLRSLRSIPGVKKVFVRSGIRFDYLIYDQNPAFFQELVEHHISGQLKVAPEHCADHVLDQMGKPRFEVYRRFIELYEKQNEKAGKHQFVVPYLMSSHPGSTLADAIALAEYLHSIDRQPEQVQDFYPTPGTISTAMYHCGYNPLTMERVYVAKTPHEKELQRALLQYKNPEKRALVAEALHKAGRPDLIGHDPRCLIRPPAKGDATRATGKPTSRSKGGPSTRTNTKASTRPDGKSGTRSDSKSGSRSDIKFGTRSGGKPGSRSEEKNAPTTKPSPRSGSGPISRSTPKSSLRTAKPSSGAARNGGAPRKPSSGAPRNGGAPRKPSDRKKSDGQGRG